MSELFNTAWGLIGAFLVFAFGAVLIVPVSRRFGVKSGRGLLLYCWHTALSVAYAVYAVSNVSDAATYFRVAAGGGVEFGTGSDAVRFLTQILVSLFRLEFLGASLCFNIVGAIGLVAIDGSFHVVAERRSLNARRLAWLMVFIPSMSFWSAGLGKDSIAFLSTGLALWAAMALERRWLLMTAAVLCMLMVRPHVAGIMSIAIIGYLVISGRLSIQKRIVLGSVGLVAGGILVRYALEYAGVSSDLGASGIQEYVNSRQGYNMEGGSSIDIASMSLPMQLFSYLFRPLPFEANSIPVFMAGLDNLALLILVTMATLNIVRRRVPTKIEGSAFMCLYVLGAWGVTAMTTANLGIAVRQKWMFLPMLLLLCLGRIGRVRDGRRRA